MRKVVGFSPTLMTICCFCRAAAQFYSSVAYGHVQLEFGESAASIPVRLLIKCGFCTRLYGSIEPLIAAFLCR